MDLVKHKKFYLSLVSFLAFTINAGSNHINVDKAKDLIFANLSVITSLKKDCVNIYIEESASNTDYLQFDIREKHDAQCGGDPATEPNIAFIRVEQSGKVLVNHYLCGYVELDSYRLDMRCDL